MIVTVNGSRGDGGNGGSDSGNGGGNGDDCYSVVVNVTKQSPWSLPHVLPWPQTGYGW